MGTFGTQRLQKKLSRKRDPIETIEVHPVEQLAATLVIILQKDISEQRLANDNERSLEKTHKR